MSIEEKIEGLTTAINQLTAIITNNSIAAGTSASTGTVKGVNGSTSEAVVEKPATKRTSKAAPKKEEAPKDDDLDMDGLNDDTPADDDLGLDDDEPEVEITQDVLKEEFKKLAKKSGGRESVQEILKSFKSTSFGDLKATDFKAAYGKVQKALN